MLDIQQKINHYRQLLAMDKDSICFADISDGFVGKIPLIANKPLNSQHIELLKIFDGGRFGCIDIWSVADLPRQQFYLETDNLLTDYSRGDSDFQDYFSHHELPSFYVFAQFLGEPILLNRDTSEVIFPIDYDSPCQIKPLVDFINTNILGAKYAEFLVSNGVQETDNWLNFIQQNHTKLN